ncbi:MAG: [ribosomal protein S5]-alanine N-acetyltransferase [Gaiellales bacterium]|nr:[ribosomal protein S5]-alanine N-acetyltransferase [Gaiellales bacterium]
MLELQRLRADHAAAVLAFELANRAYFTASISDRGDDYFEQFSARYGALLAEQEAGIGAYHVLVAEDGSVLGRFNLVFVEDGTANSVTGSRSTSPAAAWRP